MLLENKNAVIYGAGGAIGGAVARTFAREGARVFLAGRTRDPLDQVAKDIGAGGGQAEVAVLDALDEQAVDQHAQAMVGQAGRIDISFNAIGIPNTKLQGVPLIELDAEQFLLPIATYSKSYFLTARQAAHRMIPQRSGVIMSITSVPSRMGISLTGGLGPAMAAVEALTRSLSAEFAPHGIRVVGLRPDGMPESGTIKEVFGIHAKSLGMSSEKFHEMIAGKNHRRRLATLAEMSNVAVFMASESATAMTGTTVNLSMGTLDD